MHVCKHVRSAHINAVIVALDNFSNDVGVNIKVLAQSATLFDIGLHQVLNPA